MELTHQFRFIKSTWGIIITLTAFDADYDGDPECVPITSQVFIRYLLNHRITPSEKTYMASAIRRMETPLHAALPPNKKITINVMDLVFADCDCQEEGFYCVMTGWLAKRFSIEEPTTQIVFNKPKNRYEFTFS